MIQQPQKSQAKTIILIVVAVLILIFGLVILGGIAVFKSFTGTTGAAEGPAGQFLDKMQAHDYRAAYAMAMPQVQAKETVETLQDTQELMEKRYGPAMSHGAPTGRYAGINNGVTSVRLTYQERFQRGTLPLVVTVVKTPAGWRIGAYNFQM
jgi:hypothetical protein